MIGRCHQDIPEILFKKLKFNYSLTEHEYKKLILIILSPNVESDRAPFFRKNHLILNNPTFHYFSWLICKTISFVRPIYKYMFYPKGSNLTLVLKETRSTMNMGSILKGIRSDTNIILFRNPCGTVASSLKGIETGKMQPSSKAERELWYDLNKDRKYIAQLNLNPTRILSLPEHEYLALLWRLQNEDYLELSTKNNIYISYEDFMIDQKVKIKELFIKLPLSYEPSVEKFILSSSGVKNTRPLLKDSSSNFYSVYRVDGFKPDKWKDSLNPDQISGIEKHTLDIFDKLLELSNQ